MAEARGGFGGVLTSLDTRWVNHPFRVADCEFKPVQLTAARECGFFVPATVTPVTAESFDDAEISATSHAFQTFIDKTHDVRVTVAGPRMFGVAIHSTSQAGRVDWRSDYNSLHYTEIPVPDAVRNSISRYLQRFNILYGAFDFSVDRDDGWWFLECNPNGQWGFITAYRNPAGPAG